MHVASKNGLQYLFVFFQHAFQIDALILKDLLRKYLPVIDRFMDVSISNVQTYKLYSIIITPPPRGHKLFQGLNCMQRLLRERNGVFRDVLMS